MTARNTFPPTMPSSPGPPPRPKRAPRLTDDDRRLIAKARELAAPIGLTQTAAVVGFGHTADATLIWGAAFGAAQTALLQLANLADRLGADDA